MSVLRLLHVDDDEVLLRAVRRALRAEGMEMTSVPSAEDAENALSVKAFDAVLVDIDLGGASGLDLVERLRSTQPHLPVIILSGQVTPERAKRADALGVLRVFRKPASTNEIAEALRLFTGISGSDEHDAGGETG